MNVLKTMLCAAALLSLSTAAMTANKCTGADGKVSFQDAPCLGGKSETLNIKASAAVPARADGVSKPVDQTRSMSAQAKVVDAILAGEPIVGMTMDELQRALGAPTTVNSNDYRGTKKDQVIYERTGVTWLVYTEAGMVTDVQKRPQSNAVASARPVICPAAQEIRNMETSASSRTLSDAIRVEMLKQIRDAKNCGK